MAKRKHEIHHNKDKQAGVIPEKKDKMGCLMRVLILAGVIVAIIMLIVVNNNVKDIKQSLSSGEVVKSGTVETNVQTGITEQGEPIKGDEDAPVTITEWSDFECPFCTRFYEQTYPQIVEEYVETGKVKFVYRHFPLNFHPNAQKAAEASECALEQDKFWEMHDVLFEKGVSGGVASFKQYAKDLGLDTEEFNDCLDSGRMADEVADDMSQGQNAGIRGTPGFLINDQLISGAQPFENFKTVIEAELAK
jgi:protein-disulfide isomerase